MARESAEAFCKAAGVDSDRNQILMALASLKMLQSLPFRRAEADFQEGSVDTYSVEGLPSGFWPEDVGRIFHLIDNELDVTAILENTIMEELYDKFGNPSGSRTAVLHEFHITKRMLDFIERRIAGPPAAQNIFFRRGGLRSSGWSSLTVARTPKIQNTLKMLRLCGFSKHQAEHSILSCLQRTIEIECPDTSHRVKAVRISDIRLATRYGWKHQDKLFQVPERIPWEDGWIELCLDGPDAADSLLNHLRHRPSPLTIVFGEHSLPIMMVDIALRRKYDRNEIEALQAKELQRLDVLALESVAKSHPRKKSHRVQARVEFTFKNKSMGKRMSEAALNKAVIRAFGGAMHGIDGVLLPKNRHGEVDLRGNSDTFFWVSDLGPETDAESQFGKRLLAALSMCEEVPFLGNSFSSIRVKSGRPSLVQVVPVVDNPPLTVDDIARSIVTYLFTSGPAYIWEDQVWADGASNIGPTDLDGIHVDVRCICDKAPPALVFEALRQLLEQKLIVWYGPDPGPGGRTVCKFYHILKNIYRSEVGPDVEQGQVWSSGEDPVAAASEEPIATMTRGCVGADAARAATGDAGTEPGTGDATADVGTDPRTRAAAGASEDSGTSDVIRIGEAGTDPGAGDAIGDAGTVPRTGAVIFDAGTESGAGDATAGASAESGVRDAIFGVGTDLGAGAATGGARSDPGAGDVSGDAGTDPGTRAETCGESTESGTKDMIGDAGSGPGAGDVTCGMSTVADIGAGDATSDAGTVPGMGAETCGQSAESRTGDLIGEAGTDSGAGVVAGGSADSGAGDVTGDAGSESGTGAATAGASVESGMGAAIGAAGTNPGAGGLIGDAGPDPGMGATIFDADADPGVEDATGNAEWAKPGMGGTLGAAVMEPVQVCEISKLKAVRGAPFAPTVCPLSLILPGASLARLAGNQAHLLHSINSRVSSGAELQPSAIPEPPIQPVRVHLNSVPAPRRRTSRFRPACWPARPPRQRCPRLRRDDGERGSAIIIQSNSCGGSVAIGGDGSDLPHSKDSSAGDIRGGDPGRVGDYGKTRILSGGEWKFCNTSPILGGAWIFGVEPENLDDGITPESSVPESSATSCDSASDRDGSDFDDLHALRGKSVSGESGRRYRRLRWPKYAHELWLRSGGRRNPYYIHAVQLYKRSGGHHKPRMNRRRRLRLAKGCSRLTSDGRGDDPLPRPEPVPGKEVGCNDLNCWSNYKVGGNADLGAGVASIFNSSNSSSVDRGRGAGGDGDGGTEDVNHRLGGVVVDSCHIFVEGNSGAGSSTGQSIKGQPDSVGQSRGTCRGTAELVVRGSSGLINEDRTDEPSPSQQDNAKCQIRCQAGKCPSPWDQCRPYQYPSRPVYCQGKCQSSQEPGLCHMPVSQCQPGLCQESQCQLSHIQPGQGQPEHQQSQCQPGQCHPCQDQPGKGQSGQGRPSQCQPGQVQPGQDQQGQGHPRQGQPGQCQPGQGPGQPSQGQPSQGQLAQGQPGQHPLNPGPASQSKSGQCQTSQTAQSRPARIHPSQRALPETKSGETMLDATRCSLAGLCLCLLAISASAFPSSTVFCCASLPLLLHGCPFFARFLIPSQAKPVAVKRHRKRVRLKTDTVANDSIGASVQEARANNTSRDAFAFPTELWNVGFYGTFFMAVAAALFVAGIVAMAPSLAPATSAAMQAEYSNAVFSHYENGLGSVCSVWLVLDGINRSGCCGNARLEWCHGDRLSSGGGGQLGGEGGSRLGWGAGARLRSGCGAWLEWDSGNQIGWSVGYIFGGDGGDQSGCDDCDRLGPEHDSCGGGKLCGSGGVRLGWGGGDLDQLVGGMPERSSSSSQLRFCGRNSLRCAHASSARLGSDSGDGLGRGGDYGPSCDNDEGLRIGSSKSSESRSGYGVDGWKSENDGWTVGYRAAARKVSGSSPPARISFDKDNPAIER